MKSRIGNVLLAIALIAGPIGIVTATSSPAVAGTPIAYNQSGNHWSPMYAAPSFYTYVQSWLSPGEPVFMKCWLSNPNGGTGGNYATYKWFYVQSKYHGYGYINASYVYYQVAVPSC